MSDNTKRKVGRPKGAKSFVEVTLADLQQVAGPNTVIPVGRLWWEAQGGTTQERVSPLATLGSSKPEEPREKLEFTIEE